MKAFFFAFSLTVLAAQAQAHHEAKRCTTTQEAADRLAFEREKLIAEQFKLPNQLVYIEMVYQSQIQFAGSNMPADKANEAVMAAIEARRVATEAVRAEQDAAYAAYMLIFNQLTVECPK